MPLSKTETELIKTIQERLQRGDIKAISEKTGVHRDIVARSLNITTEVFNEPVVKSAVAVIKEREKKAETLLNSLSPQ